MAESGAVEFYITCNPPLLALGVKDLVKSVQLACQVIAQQINPNKSHTNAIARVSSLRSCTSQTYRGSSASPWQSISTKSPRLFNF